MCAKTALAPQTCCVKTGEVVSAKFVSAEWTAVMSETVKRGWRFSRAWLLRELSGAA